MDISLFRQACLHMLQGRYQDALADLSVMAQLYPQHAETQANLGTCYLQLSKYNEAISHYLQALTLVPGDAQLLFNLGVISMKLGRVREAIAYYGEVLKIEPGHFAAHNNLGVACLSMQDRPTALRHFRAALQADPINTAVRHTIRLLEGQTAMTTVPEAYVKSLFDSYADHYDDHLRQSLNYKVPEAMYVMVSACTAYQHDGCRILDLGCGTGLCGELVKPIAKLLIGVDLSSGMLQIAHRKNIYDELIEAEAVAFMRKNEAGFDLIMAGDVLVYMGQLEELMDAAAGALQEGGWFVFSAERSHGKGVELASSGRFAHTRDYIETAAACYGFRVAAYESSVLRTQQQVAVPGHLYLMQKLSA